jgi:hypothetical protein
MHNTVSILKLPGKFKFIDFAVIINKKPSPRYFITLILFSHSLHTILLLITAPMRSAINT